MIIDFFSEVRILAKSMSLLFFLETQIFQSLLQFPNMTTLYLHGNQLMSLNEVKRLSGLPCLRTLTLHGEFESYSGSAVKQDWPKTPLNAFFSVTDISLIDNGLAL